MKKIKFLKQFSMLSFIAIALVACTTANNQPQRSNSNNTNMSNAQSGAILGAILGAGIGAVTKGSRGKRVILGGAIGAAVGGGIGYSMDQQAKEMAYELDTNVNNNPNAASNADNDLIVSNTDKYVKIMLRDKMVFQTDSATPTYEASRKIAKITDVLRKYPNTLVQVVGFTDNRGSYEYNQKLSEQRAANVGNTIYNYGIENQIFSKGCSYYKPVAPNTDAINMGLNRRVEIYLYANQADIVDACIN